MTRSEGGKKRGCGCWGVLALVILIVVAWLFAVRWGALERLGLRQTASEIIYSGPPDWEAANVLRTELQARGLNTQGLEVYVLPITGSDGNTAIFVLDSSTGFDPNLVARGNYDWGLLRQLAAGPTLNELEVERVALDYRGQGGDSVANLTVETGALQSFARGESTEKDLARSVMGDVNLVYVTQEVLR